jgi:hypothetical protein
MGAGNSAARNGEEFAPEAIDRIGFERAFGNENGFILKLRLPENSPSRIVKRRSRTGAALAGATARDSVFYSA